MFILALFYTAKSTLSSALSSGVHSLIDILQLSASKSNRTMSVLKVFVLFIALSAFRHAAGQCSGCSESAMDATNSYRQQNGLPALTYSAAFYQRCLAHSREMAAKGSLYHTNLGSGVMAENVAMRSSGGSAGTLMVQQWIDSPGHRANMVGNYKCGATALYEQGGSVWGTQMFGDCSDGSSRGSESTEPSSSEPNSKSDNLQKSSTQEPSSSSPDSDSPKGVPSSGPMTDDPTDSDPMSTEPAPSEPSSQQPGPQPTPQIPSPWNPTPQEPRSRDSWEPESQSSDEMPTGWSPPHRHHRGGHYPHHGWHHRYGH